MKDWSMKMTAHRKWPLVVARVTLARVTLAGVVLASVPLCLFGLSGCRGATKLATEAIAGKEVADSLTHSERDATLKDVTSRKAQAEAKRFNNDPRVLLGAHLNTSWMEFRTQPSPMQAAEPAVWTMNIWQIGKPAKNNNWIDEFKYAHDKLLHLIVVSKDLAYFNHVYPDFRGDGLFITSQTLPRGGTYKAFAAYTPMRGVQEVAQHEFKVLAAGAVDAPSPVFSQSPVFLLKVDEAVHGWMTRRVISKPEGQPEAAGGEAYRIGLMLAPQPAAGQPVTLHFRLRNIFDQPVTDLQPYLGAMGYAVILSADSKIFLDVRPTDDAISDISNVPNGNDAAHESDESSTRLSASAAGPDVSFQTVFPAAGLYKIWGQFQHKGRIITAPFVVRVSATKAQATKRLSE